MNMQPMWTKISQLYGLLLKHWKFIINKKDLYLNLTDNLYRLSNRREINWDALSEKNINFPIRAMLYHETNILLVLRNVF